MEHKQKVARTIVFAVLAVLVRFLVQHLLEELPKLRGDDTTRQASGFVAEAPTRPTLDEVGGHDAIKEDLKRSVVMPLRNPALFFSEDTPRAIRPAKGILLYGPPGTGKTMLAQAAACESGAKFMALHSANLESKWFGETPKLLQAAFATAKKQAPCVIFFDEIDGLGRARGEQDQSCVYAFKCELLRALDAITPTSGVVVIGCTNCPNALDPAVRRRFQRHVLVDLPSAKERRDILATFKAEPGEAVDALAQRAAGWTGADLAMVYERAASQRVFGARDVVQLVKRAKSAKDLEASLPSLSVEDIERAAKDCGKALRVADAKR